MKPALTALMLLLTAGAAAQSLPALTGGPDDYTLTVPYVEYGSGPARQAFTVRLESADLLSFRLSAASPATPRPLAAGTRLVTVSGGPPYRLSVPALTSSAGVFAAEFVSTDLSVFALDPASVRAPAPTGSAPPTGVAVSAVDPRTVGARTAASSTRLDVSWTAPQGDVHHYEVVASESVGGTSVSATAASGQARVSLAGLKAATTYAVVVTACRDAACADNGSAAPVTGATDTEYWQLQGTGHTVSGLTMPVADGNARLSATRFGPEAGAMANRIQFYYGPFGSGRRSPLSTAATSVPATADDPSSYLSFTSRAATTGLITPGTATPLVQEVATGQGVPLSAALGARVRLFFEARGGDGRTRVLSVDSQDGYVGQDFNPGPSGVCEAAADYEAGGGCEPAVVLGVDGDAVGGNPRIKNARQFKLAWPTQDDWRWDGQPGRFMVFTTDDVAGCTTARMNHGYAVWDGTRFVVQYREDGCPKLFANAQAALPMHVGDVRYKMYYADRTREEGRYGSSRLPFPGPKVLIYADGRTSGAADVVDFEDWEAQAGARDVVFLWPNGEVLDARAEGYIDDYHFLAPTGSLDLQVMYLTITDGVVVPIAATAVLVNP